MALTQVSTKGIKDGTILNADLNASASIAGTKISPDFGSQNITTTGRLLLGTTTEGHTDADDLTIATSSGYAGITLRSPSDQGGAIYFSDATSGAGEYDGQILYSQSSRTMQLITANNPRLTLDSSGNLLSGTTSSSLLSNFNTNAGGLVLDDIGSGATAFLATHGDKQIFLGNDTSANYLWGYSNHNLLFGTNNQTRLTITSDGNVGIGTTTPGNLLHCSRTSTTAYSSSLTTNDSTVLLQNLGAAGHSTLEFQCKSSGTTQTGKATISATPEAASSRATSLTFGTRHQNSAMEERMRIDSFGRVAVGTTDMNGRIHARINAASSTNFADNNAAIASGDQFIHVSNSNTGGNEQAGFVMNASGSASAIGAIYMHKTNSYLGAMVFRMRTNATTSASRMEIDSQGNIGAPNGTNIHSTSDARVKKNVADLTNGLSSIKSLRPVSFNWIDGFCDKEKNTLYGFIAQEVQTVDSNLIQQFGDGSVTVEGQTINDVLRVNEKFIIPMLVKAIQELSAEVAALKAG